MTKKSGGGGFVIFLLIFLVACFILTVTGSIRNFLGNSLYNLPAVGPYAFLFFKIIYIIGASINVGIGAVFSIFVSAPALNSTGVDQLTINELADELELTNSTVSNSTITNSTSNSTGLPDPSRTTCSSGYLFIYGERWHDEMFNCNMTSDCPGFVSDESNLYGFYCDEQMWETAERINHLCWC